VVSFSPRPLYPQGKSPWYPLDRRLGGPQSQSGYGGEEKMIFTYHRNQLKEIEIFRRLDRPDLPIMYSFFVLGSKNS
jgi:hypothetical protein